MLANFVPKTRSLYAVHRSGQGPFPWIPASEYAVFVGDADRTLGAAYFVSGNGVVGAVFLPWDSLQQVLAGLLAQEALLPLRLSMLSPTPSPVPLPSAALIPTPTPAALTPVVPSGTAAIWYPSDTLFVMTDVFDLQRIPQVDTTTWQTVTTAGNVLSVRYPPGWTAS